MKIPKIVLTGGPCAGKTTALAYLSEKLREIGRYPLFVPEAPTILLAGGVTPVGGHFDVETFEAHIIDLMLHFEAQYERAAHSIIEKRPVIVCDRGIMDTKAYMPEAVFWKLMRERGLDYASARDSRYLGVFHLRSAALGAEECYTLATNAVRREGTLAEAREADQKTLDAWIGHPHLAVIDNEGKNFEQKLHLLWKKLCRVLGVPVPLEIERKFLVRPGVQPSDILAHLGAQNSSRICQSYIVSHEPDVTELRIRARRPERSHPTYYETKKRELRPGVRVETERLLTQAEYDILSRYRLPGTSEIRKRRTNFVYREQYFELDHFSRPKRHEGLMLLEVELTEENDRVELPSFIEIAREVTGDPRYSNRVLATA